ncbi:hypothetical protein FRZ06_04595 [Anoxybacterium hadale]|uniref:Uncharacterized protein n=1 Tax=Anoxybacterium hadale TaxID=3408580 RepID=A0ACD1A8J0_9FIRM|nr:hypothetical protein FRZ06_04595 [Clostridiales bacterium]
MKKTTVGRAALLIAMMLFILFAVSGCAKGNQIELRKLPKDYSLEDAKKDGCVVFEDLDITSGQSTWDDFIATTEKKEPASVRIAYYYTLGDKSKYASEYYEEIKDDYPILYIQELRYDGDSYILDVNEEEGQVISHEYLYLLRYEGKPDSPNAIFTDYVYYVLVNDPNVTWDELEKGMLSSDLGDHIDHRLVYSDLKFRE